MANEKKETRVIEINFTLGVFEDEDTDEMFEKIHEVICDLYDNHGPEEPCVRLFSAGAQTSTMDEWTERLEKELEDGDC